MLREQLRRKWEGLGSGWLEIGASTEVMVGVDDEGLGTLPVRMPYSDEWPLSRISQAMRQKIAGGQEIVSLMLPLL